MKKKTKRIKVFYSFFNLLCISWYSIQINKNKYKIGIYLWTNKRSKKCYVGFSSDLSCRLKDYFYKSYLIREVNNNKVI